MNKNAYLVLGPESSGTRMMTEILISAGCIGSAEHEQFFDCKLPKNGISPIVWRRSFPHAGKWPQILKMKNQLLIYNYNVKSIVMTRDMSVLIKSQMSTWGRSEKEAVNNIRSAYAFIFNGLMQINCPYIVISYESLMQQGLKVLDNLLPIIGLGTPEKFDFYDGNMKWYRDQ